MAFNQTAVGVTSAILGVALYWIVDQFPKFDELAPTDKRYCVLALCILFPMAAMGLSVLTNCVAFEWGLLWQAAEAGGVAFVTSQYMHGKASLAKAKAEPVLSE